MMKSVLAAAAALMAPGRAQQKRNQTQGTARRYPTDQFVRGLQDVLTGRRPASRQVFRWSLRKFRRLCWESGINPREFEPKFQRSKVA